MDKLKKARKRIDATDKKMAALFCRRMKTAETIFAYKKERGLPIRDPEREDKMVDAAENRVSGALRASYRRFLQTTVALSRGRQEALQAKDVENTVSFPVISGAGSYQIYCGNGLTSRAGKILPLNRKVLILTDGGVPSGYAEALAPQCGEPHIFIVPQGEASKSPESWQKISKAMLEAGFTREDCIVALGGGMVGDLAGFTASSYMRGIDFYNIPTTLLSQVDSSVGGKTALNFEGNKNVLGAFNPPSAVLLDTDLLYTLSPRLWAEGLAEIIKMACTCDAVLFEELEALLLEKGLDALTAPDEKETLKKIILSALAVKRDVVERDEYEAGPRRVLNFGHTAGHAIEAESALLHGECVALGMLVFSSDAVKERLTAIYRAIGLPTFVSLEAAALAAPISHDKKAGHKTIKVVYCEEIGTYEIREMKTEDILKMAEKICRKENI